MNIILTCTAISIDRRKITLEGSHGSSTTYWYASFEFFPLAAATSIGGQFQVDKEYEIGIIRTKEN